jgi:hypothetical protein
LGHLSSIATKAIALEETEIMVVQKKRAPKRAKVRKGEIFSQIKLFGKTFKVNQVFISSSRAG